MHVLFQTCCDCLSIAAIWSAGPVRRALQPKYERAQTNMSSGSTSVDWSKGPAVPIYRGSKDFPCRESTTGLESDSGFDPITEGDT